MLDIEIIKKNAKAVDVKARAVRTEYVSKTKKLDRLYAPETETPGPFEKSLSTFHGGGVTPLCFGAFGEASEAVDIYLKHCAKLAANRQDGMAMSPLDSSVDSRGAYNLIVRQYRVTLAVLVAKENALLKVKRLQFIRPTKESAAFAASEQKRGGTNQFNMGGPDSSQGDTYSYYFSAGRHRTL